MINEEIKALIKDLNSKGIPINEQDVNTVLFDACSIFSEWILRKRLYTVTHDFDPPFDCSGELRDEERDLHDYIDKDVTFDMWASTNYTGVSNATYVSGCGLSYETYSREIEESIEEYFNDIIQERLEGKYENLYDDFLEKFDGDLWTFYGKIYEIISALTLDLCWDLGKKLAEEKIQREEEEAEIRNKQHLKNKEISENITLKYFSYFEKRLEMPQKKGFLAHVKEIYKTLTDEELEALKDIGLKLNLSRRLKYHTDCIATDELNSRHKNEAE